MIFTRSQKRLMVVSGQVIPPCSPKCIYHKDQYMDWVSNPSNLDLDVEAFSSAQN